MHFKALLRFVNGRYYYRVDRVSKGLEMALYWIYMLLYIVDLQLIDVYGDLEGEIINTLTSKLHKDQYMSCGGLCGTFQSCNIAL